ncbi:MAG: prepilin-type N-terminal cleavage/methylation domain-containing protein [Vicinamibacteria bacterium]|nr:prepilin-type N-terminal cleavage/methylation domain-containing protein [Vicinamibacteria bacterium]
MALAKSRCSNQAGFSLIEVLAAMVILSVALVSLAQLFAVSTRSNFSSRSNTYAALLAQQKLEQLRGLTWGFDILGLPVSDYTSDTSASEAISGCVASAGGSATGLSPSPWGTLQQNSAGWVDYIDENGCILGGGGAAPARTKFIRRWSVEPLPSNPNNTLILQVLVTRRANRGAADAGNVGRMNDEARLMSVKTRKTK